MAYTIKEVAQKTGISAHTLRYWAKIGLFPDIERVGASSVRYFSEKDLGWVAIVHCLRQSGLSVDAIKEYVRLCFVGESTFEKRLEIIKTQRDATLELIAAYEKALNKLNTKVKFYEDEIKKRDKKAARTKDIYNPAQKESVVKGYFNEVQGYESLGDNAARKLGK